MTKRKHISWKTKYASALLALGHVPYDHAKELTEDQIISLYQIDHFPHLHESEHPDRDKYWNLEPVLIKAHREKTKTDVKTIAKSKRIRFKNHMLEIDAELRKEVGNDKVLLEVAREAYWEGRHQGGLQANDAWVKEANRPGGALQWSKLRSRGFDKTLRKKMDGTVVKR